MRTINEENIELIVTEIIDGIRATVQNVSLRDQCIAYALISLGCHCMIQEIEQRSEYNPKQLLLKGVTR